jgi:hypothetical protein
MSGTPGHPMSRRALADTLDEVIEVRGVRDIADVIGVGKSTVHRRGHDLSQWPVSDFLALCITEPGLWAAACTYVEGDHAEIDQAAVVLRVVADADLAEVSETMSALADGVIDPDEARRLLKLDRQSEAARRKLRAVLEQIAGVA